MAQTLESRPLWISLTGFVFTLAISLLAHASPTGANTGAIPFPMFVLIALFIWSVRRPGFVSAPVLLVVGLFQDLLSGTPLGVWALAYITAFALAGYKDEEGNGGDVGPLSIRFAIVTLIAYAVAWAAGSAAISAYAGVTPLAIEAVLTLGIFPLFAWAFARRKERPAMFKSGRGS